MATLYFVFSKVSTRRIIAGKWGNNNGQACVSPDYIITTKDFAPKLVRFLEVQICSIFVTFSSHFSSSLGGFSET